MFLQIFVLHSVMKLLPSAITKREVTKVAAAPGDDASETTCPDR